MNGVPGKNFLAAISATLTSLLQEAMFRIFGPRTATPILGPLSLADFAAMGCSILLFLALSGVVWLGLKIKTGRAKPEAETEPWRLALLRASGKPLQLLIWLYGGYFVLTPPVMKLGGANAQTAALPSNPLDSLFGFGSFVVIFWLFFRLTHVLELRLAAWAASTSGKLDDLFVPLLGRSLRVIIPVLGIIFALPLIRLPLEYAGIVSKGSTILLIGTVTWVVLQAIHAGERAVMTKYDLSAADNLQARKVYTQVHVISKTLYVIVGIFAAASVLMLFDEVRRFGTSLLASAGVVGIIGGFAAQRTIANLFAGFQLAMTQPIRLDDVVIVEGEWGRVEEITLTYVVIHIWDDRRLVVPLSYFIERPFQNWTRISASLLGSVFLWVDYSLPLDEVRAAVKSIVERSELWDKRFWNLQVTEATERAMQIRILATAADSGKAWNLRCEIREHLIQFIQQQFPGGLPRVRAELDATTNSLLGGRVKPAL